MKEERLREIRAHVERLRAVKKGGLTVVEDHGFGEMLDYIDQLQGVIGDLAEESGQTRDAYQREWADGYRAREAEKRKELLRIRFVDRGEGEGEEGEDDREVARINQEISGQMAAQGLMSQLDYLVQVIGMPEDRARAIIDLHNRTVGEEQP